MKHRRAYGPDLPDRCWGSLADLLDAAYADGMAEIEAKRAAVIRECEDTPEQRDWESDELVDNLPCDL